MKKITLLVFSVLFLAILTSTLAASGVFTSGKFAIASTQLRAELFVNGSSEQVPRIPQLVGSVNNNTALNFAQAAKYHEGYVYVVGAPNFLTIIDVQKPEAPVIVGAINATEIGPGTDLAVDDKYAYITSDTHSRLVVVNITNKTNPEVVSVAAISSLSTSIEKRGSYIYLFSLSGLEIWDSNIPTNLTRVSTLTISFAIPYMVSMQGDYLYAITYPNVFNVINVSNPKSPTIASSTANMGGYYVAVRGPYAFITDDDNSSLNIVNISDPTSPKYVTKETIGASPYSIVLSGNAAYVTSYISGTIYTVDITNVSDPVYLGSLSLGSSLSYTRFDIANGYAYIPGDDYLYVLDLGAIESVSADIGSISTDQLDFQTLRTNTLTTYDLEAEDLIVTGDFFIGHDDSGYPLPATGGEKSMYLTSITQDGNHNCDENPENCCKVGYHMCTALEFLEGGLRIETSGGNVNSTPYGISGDVDPGSESNGQDCSGWTSSSTSHGKYRCSYTTSTSCSTTGFRCDDSDPTWCCSD